MAPALALLLVTPISMGEGPAGHGPLDAIRPSADDPLPPVPPRPGFESLPLSDLALTVAATEADTAAGQRVLAQLEALDGLPPIYHAVAREALTGLAISDWHSEQAVRGLTEAQRAALGSLGPDQDPGPDVLSAIPDVDAAQVQASLAALAASAQRIERLVKDGPRASDGLAAEVADRLGVEAREVQMARGIERHHLATLLVSLGLDPEAADAATSRVPEHAVPAVHTLLQAVAASGFAPGDPRHAVHIASAVDATRPVLEVWAAAAKAGELSTGPPFVLPEPGDMLQLPKIATGAPLRTDLEGAFTSWYAFLGEDEAQRRAAAAAERLRAGLDGDRLDATSDTLQALADLLHAQQHAHATRPPSQVDASVVASWAHRIGQGDMPAPGSDEADTLLASDAYLTAQLDVLAAIQNVLDAVERLPTAFARPASGHEAACEDDPISIPPLVTIDACGHDTRYDTDALLVVDAGGDDTYLQRAGAPFAPEGTAPGTFVPFNVLVDLGGNDTYDASGQDCAQGAACSWHESFFTPGDQTGEYNVTPFVPLSLLIDYAHPGTESTNRFSAGGWSQGYGGPPDRVPSLVLPRIANQAIYPAHYYPAVGLLVEWAGDGAKIRSEYSAGDNSQGSNMPGPLPPHVEEAFAGPAPEHGGFGGLWRVVGDGADSAASLRAGDFSQAASAVDFNMGTRETAQALLMWATLLNLGGRDSRSDDTYEAGRYSQGATDPSRSDGRALAGRAVFMDVVGPGGRSDDIYDLNGVGPARGVSEGAELGSSLEHAFSAWFVDAALPAPGVTAHSDPAGLLVGLRGGPDEETGGDIYRGDIPAGRGYGIESGLFVDIGGTDTYVLPGTWDANDRPRDESKWHPAPPNATVTTMLAGNECNAGVLTHCGMDLGARDGDHDGFPAFLEDLWPFWTADPDGPSAPAPAGLRAFVAQPTTGAGADLDGSYLLAITSPRPDTFGSDFAAALQIDLGGRDMYSGWAAAAVGATEATPASTEEATPPVRGASVLVDLGGDDTYRAARPMNQGYAAANATSILFDLGGDDHYEAGSRSQGYGVDGGVGILVDASTPWEENRFRADAPAQGRGERGGVGLLIGTGGHNSYRDGVSEGGSGSSVNLGTNRPPRIIGEDFTVEEGGTPLGPDLDVSETYTWTVKVRDSEDDDMRLCWIFAHGDGQSTRCEDILDDGSPDYTSTVEFGWTPGHPVPTVRGHPSRSASVELPVTVEVVDTGGEMASVTRDFQVHNEPPEFAGPVQGPDETPVRSTTAYQAPFHVADGITEPRVAVEWGDGTGRSEFAAHEVNWALSLWGASVRLPEAVPTRHGSQSVFVNPGNPVQNAIDGNNKTFAQFVYEPNTANPPVHFGVDLPGTRHIHRIELNVSAGLTPVSFVVEGIDADGLPHPIEVVSVDDRDPATDLLTVDLEGLPRYDAVRFSQAIGVDPDRKLDLEVREIRILGPGATHTWNSVGEFTMTYQMFDDHGGSVSQEATVEVVPGGVPVFDLTRDQERNGLLSGLPLVLADVDGRGAYRHVTVPAYVAHQDSTAIHQDAPVGENGVIFPIHAEDPRNVSITLRSTSAHAGTVCLQFGDETQRCKPLPARDAPDPSVRFEHRWMDPGDYLVTATVDDGAGPSVRTPVTTIHAEEAFHLRNGAESILFLALDQTADRTSWHLYPHDGQARIRALVDASGDDRYVGMVAGSQGPAGAGSMVVDLAGDDTYVSFDPLAQGAASSVGTAVLLDADGDDVYLAPALAQGAARLGSGALLMDLGGDDHFNPIPVESETARLAVPDTWSVWTDRPPQWTPLRHPLAPPPGTLMQGAASDAVAALVLRGGVDRLSAGSHGQGYSEHDPRVGNATQYLLPGHDCLMGENEGGLTGVPDQISFDGILCGLGIEDFEPMGGADGLPDFDPSRLARFLGPEGPRYSPSLGLLVLADGATVLNAESQAQGASRVAARAGLIDLDGATVMTAHNRSQAYTEAGQAFLAVAGEMSAAVSNTGQGVAAASARPNPEPAAPPGDGSVSLFIGPLDTAWCDDDASCGSPPDERPVGQIDIRPAVDQKPRPDVQWTDLDTPLNGAPAIHSGRTYNASLRLLELPIDAQGQGIQHMLAATPWTTAESGRCAGAPLGPTMTLSSQGTAPVGPAVDWAIPLRSPFADGPSGPAGCYQVVAFVRTAELASGSPTSGWARIGGHVWLLPPPILETPSPMGEIDGLPFWPTSEDSIEITVRSREPLAAVDGGPVLESEYRLVDESDQKVDTAITPRPPASPQDPGSWSESLDIATDLPSGTYRLQGRSQWSTAAQTSGWKDLANVAIDRAPPSASLDGPGERAWKGSEGLPLAGQVVDPGTDVDAVQVRVVREGCGQSPSCVIPLRAPSYAVSLQCQTRGETLAQLPPEELRPWQECVLGMFVEGLAPLDGSCDAPECIIKSPETDKVEAVEAALHREEAARGQPWQWEALVATSPTFRGGPVEIEVKTTDRGGATSGWQPIEGPVDYIIDKSAPSATSLAAGSGTPATNRFFDDGAIDFDVQVQECAAVPTSVTGDCIPGSGIAPGSAAAVLQHVASGETTTLPAHRIIEDGPDGAGITFRWHGEDPSGPDAGKYLVRLQLADNAGNLLLVNPGMDFVVDRTPPTIVAETILAGLPQGQKAVKPGDTLGVRLEARDHGADATRVSRVEVSLGGSDAVLEPAGPGHFEGSIIVPGGLTGSSDPDDATVSLQVVARDLASNAATASSGPIAYREDPPTVEDLEATIRSSSVTLSWSTSRPVSFEAATLIDPVGTRIEGVLDSDGTHHTLFFGDLRDDETYEPRIRMADDASHTLDLGGVLGSLETPLRQDTDILLNPPPPLVYSGPVTIDGHIRRPVDSEVSLHVGADAAAPPVQTLAIVGGAESTPFSFEIDPEEHAPESASGQVEAPFRLVMDDGATQWIATGSVTFDRAPPTLAPHVEGRLLTDAWYNRTVRLSTGADDESGPLAHRIRVGQEGPWQDLHTVSIPTEGTHEVAFEVQDGARPPNVAQGQVTVRIDKTPPELEVSAAGPGRAVNTTRTQVQVDASEPAGDNSGFDGVRVRGPDLEWSAWSPPGLFDVDLSDEEGEYWVDAQARDAAGNIRSRSLNVLLDRTPPDPLLVRWNGVDDESTPLLYVVSQDRINGSLRPAGIEAVRVASVDAGPPVWGPWIPSDGSDQIPVDAPGLLTWVEIRDHAGNRVVAGPVGPPTDAAPAAPAQRPTPFPMVGDLHVSPDHGSSRTRFTFLANVAGDPDKVTLEVGDRVFEMEPAAGSADGQLYRYVGTLEPSSLDAPHTFRVHAHMGDHGQISGWAKGPTVTALPPAANGSGADGAQKESAALPAALVVAALGLAAFRRRWPL